jgi:hypothetical protein
MSRVSPLTVDRSQLLRQPRRLGDTASFRVARELVLRQDAPKPQLQVRSRPDREPAGALALPRNAVERRDFLLTPRARFDQIHRRARLAARHPAIVVNEAHGPCTMVDPMRVGSAR